MILLDTNLLIYASNDASEYGDWSKQTIAEAVVREGAAIDAVSLAEVCVGEEEPETAADVCATAYRCYRERRHSQSGKESPAVPLPDFFIGAHAQIMAWDLATVDEGRFRTYFPSVTLRTP